MDSSETGNKDIYKLIETYLKQQREDGEQYLTLYADRDLSHRDESSLAESDIPSGIKTLDELSRFMADCHKCEHLASKRSNLVFGEGNPDADIVFVGEAPGADEDRQGFPFVGRAGQLLTKIINAMGFQRSEVYIMNILKCRPPENRDPQPDEIERCRPYFERQLDILKPKIIVALGRVSAHTLLATETPISKLRGRLSKYRGIPIMPTFHPSYLLRNPAAKKEVWEDMKAVLELLKDNRK